MAFDTKTNPQAGVPVDRLWYFDPTPTNHSEFGMQQTLVRDLSPAAKDLFYDGSPRDVLEAGFRGEAFGKSGAAAVPEPGAWLLALLGLAGLGLSRLRRPTQSR